MTTEPMTSTSTSTTTNEQTTNMYDRVAGIDFDALSARTGIPADDLRAWDREEAGYGIEILMATVDALEAKVERLRKALRSADSRVIQYQAEEWTARHGGVQPSLDWFRRAIGTQESNHYAVDGLKIGDLDDQPGDLPNTPNDGSNGR